MDEPTAGVDVQLKQNLWKNVKQLNKLGVTIILTTHYLAEAQEMCNRIAIINKGELRALDTTNNLLDKIETKKAVLKVENISKLQKLHIDGIKFSIQNSNEIVTSYKKKQHNFEQIINLLKKSDIKILDISTEEGDLEDVFIQLTKN